MSHSSISRPRAAELLAACAALTAALLLTMNSASATPQELAQRYPKDRFASVEQADQALREVRQERAVVEAEFADAQYACYSKFFSSPCVEHAKEQRRDALKTIRAVEVDAEAYKRRQTVVERDRALRQQAERDAAEAPERAVREKENEEKTAQRAADRAARASAQPAGAGPGAGNPPATAKPERAAPAPGRDRVAEHEAKVREQQRESEAGAAQRAQNIADYQRKQEEAKERQRRVAEKVAEREQKLKEKAAQGGAANTPAPAGAK